MKKHNPQDATKGVQSRARDRAIAKAEKRLYARIAEITKRLDVIEDLIDHGKGPFRKD